MRTILKVQAATYAAILTLGLGMASCSTMPRVVGAETATKVEQTSLRAAKTALTVWSLTQDAILVYGRLPYCDPELPDLHVCKGRASWAKVKAIEAQTSAVVLAAKPIVEAGTDDAAFLMGVVAAVNDGFVAVNQAKGKD